MSAQLFVFTGLNDFALRDELKRWTSEFTERHGEENLTPVDGERTTYRELLDSVSSAPFIAEKRLVIIRGIPRGTKEDIDRLLASIHPAVIVVFVDPAPDKRLGSVKALLQVATVREWNPVRTAELRRWMTQYLSQWKTTIDAPAADRLIDRVGEDQQLLSMELRKLALHGGVRPISIADVNALVVYQGERQVWALMELLRKGGAADAIGCVRDLLAGGESAQGLWAMLLWMLANVAPVASSAARNGGNPAAVAKETGVNIRTVRSLLPLVRGKSNDEIAALVDRIVDYDMALKTGELRATDGEPQELTATIERVLIACCS